MLVVLALVVASAAPASAEIGLVLLEPVGTLGFWTRVGHAATYLSNVCPDDSPVRMRLCRPGELGGVVSRYAPFSEREAYDWAIVPFETYLHGFPAAELAPIVVTRRLQDLVERRSFDGLFSHALTARSNGDLPAGQWKATLANRYVRNLYVFSVATTREDDEAIVEEFNRAPNRSCFNFFYGNCSNQAKRVFKLVLPEPVGDRVGGVSMEAPKGLVKALVARALEHPEFGLRARRYPQLPGPFPPSSSALFPLENMYKSIALLPWWYYEGFRVVGAGAIFYHQVISPFDIRQAVRAFGSPRATRLTLEQRRLRRQQDEVRRAFSRAVANSEPWSRLATLDAAVDRRLARIGRELQHEVARVDGTPAAWHERRLEFTNLMRAAAQTGGLPARVSPWVDRAGRGGRAPTLSRKLLRFMEKEAEISIDAGSGGPWIRLTFADQGTIATGLSRAEVLAGDPLAAVLVLAAGIDANVNGPEASRDGLAEVDALLARLRLAVDVLAAGPGAR